MVTCRIRNHAAKQEEAMKWRELYSGLEMRKQADQPDFECPDYFNRMVMGNEFALDPFHDVDDETSLRTDQSVNVQITQACVKGSYPHQYLELTCTTTGMLPPGIVHGTYVLKFEYGQVCHELPPEMFVDREFPKEELSHWFV